MEIDYYTIKRERDLLKYNLETAKEKLLENNINIELEIDSGKKTGKGIKLIKEYTNKIKKM